MLATKMRISSSLASSSGLSFAGCLTEGTPSISFSVRCVSRSSLQHDAELANEVVRRLGGLGLTAIQGRATSPSEATARQGAFPAFDFGNASTSRVIRTVKSSNRSSESHRMPDASTLGVRR